jgi:rubrerythrin
MIAALRGAVFEALKREDDMVAMFDQLTSEAKDDVLKKFFHALAEDARRDVHMLKRLDLHSIVKFGLAIKFEAPSCKVDEHTVKTIKDVAGAKEQLKIALDQLNVNIEYCEHIAEHALFPDVKRLFRILADKELEHKCILKAMMDLLE